MYKIEAFLYYIGHEEIRLEKFRGTGNGVVFFCRNITVTGTAMSSRSTMTSVTDEFCSAKDDMYHVRIVGTRHFTVI